ncbi:hypothetical protein J6590_073563 [Homalodisca vitripennis]|nr:hypothetical protein J6590_073563 [Homalodisca vitripennis]
MIVGAPALASLVSKMSSKLSKSTNADNLKTLSSNVNLDSVVTTTATSSATDVTDRGTWISTNKKNVASSLTIAKATTGTTTSGATASTLSRLTMSRVERRCEVKAILLTYKFVLVTQEINPLRTNSRAAVCYLASNFMGNNKGDRVFTLPAISLEILTATQLILFYRSSDPGSVHLAIVAQEEHNMEELHLV